MTKIILHDLIYICSNDINLVIVKAPVNFAGISTTVEVVTLYVIKTIDGFKITTSNKSFTTLDVITVINKNVKCFEYVPDGALIVELENA